MTSANGPKKKVKKLSKSPAAATEASLARTRVFALNEDDTRLLKRIGLCIARRLNEQGRSVEDLASQLSIARSTLREIIAGRSNARILTLNSIANGLGYPNLVSFLEAL